MHEPIVFEPVYQERVWGGRVLASRFGRVLPKDDAPYGESWEVSDRPEARSVAASPLAVAGKTLGDLWRDEREAIFGREYAGREGAFPLLVKILDARDRLSIQVHPPAAIAGALGGEAKTEMWYIADAEPGAVLYAGLRRGVTRADFERGIAAGKTERQVHRIPVAPGDFIFIPSGRLHAIGAGILIYEIQENSDTTFRVFDWNRVGLDGEPRRLHLAESLRCIDFADVEPGVGVPEGECLVSCPEFVVERWELGAGECRAGAGEGRFAIVTVVRGTVGCGSRAFTAGDFFLVPANAEGAAARLAARGGGAATVLRTTLPAAG